MVKNKREGRNKAKVEVEVKSGKVKKRKQMQGKRVRKAVLAQEGRISRISIHFSYLLKLQ